jgi:alkanesulfonate monooxygenase SsuD/methylene tetrahydromethanopterin reductase-like flavin-dependent oxidoreductase (luciferase family)
MRLGLLDFCQLRKGVSPQQVLHETIALAQAAEAQGFSRYWLTEHHELNSAHHAPDLLPRSSPAARSASAWAWRACC